MKTLIKGWVEQNAHYSLDRGKSHYFSTEPISGLRWYFQKH